MPDETFRCGHPRTVENSYRNGVNKSRCRICAQARSREQYVANRDRIKRQAQAWRESHPESVRTSQERYRRRTRGAWGSREHIEKLTRAMQGARNGQWRGDLVSYSGIHGRARASLPRECLFCGATDGLDVAFRWDTPDERVRVTAGGRIYSVDLCDYIRLCRSCHRKYDRPAAVVRS